MSSTLIDRRLRNSTTRIASPIAASAAALRELYDSIARPRTLTEENPAAIFDRAVCRTETANFAALVPLLLTPDEVATLAAAGGHERLIGASGVRL